MDCPPLTTARLALRSPHSGDVDAIVWHVGDWEVARNLSVVPHPYGPDDARFFLEHVVPADWVWAITRHGEDALLGVVGFSPAPEGGSAELGYWLGRAHWGQGLMTEAARAVVAFGFETLGLSALTSGYFADNPGSRNVLTKLGFAETGQSLRPCIARGIEVPSFDMRLQAPAA